MEGTCPLCAYDCARGDQCDNWYVFWPVLLAHGLYLAFARLDRFYLTHNNLIIFPFFVDLCVKWQVVECYRAGQRGVCSMQEASGAEGLQAYVPRPHQDHCTSQYHAIYPPSFSPVTLFLPIYRPPPDLNPLDPSNIHFPNLTVPTCSITAQVGGVDQDLCGTGHMVQQCCGHYPKLAGLGPETSV